MSPKSKAKKTERKTTFGLSLLMFLITISILLVAVLVLKADSQVPLLMCSTVLILYSLYLRIPWKEMEEEIYQSISGAVSAIVLVLLVGAVVGIWIACGTVPAIIYYGLKLLRPEWFLVFVLLICTVMSTTTGSSWTTIATLGIAFMGIGSAMQIPEGMTAGAVLCGAYFGDKQSPIAASANFAAAVAKCDIFSMAGSMLYTSIPALLGSAVLFFFLGGRYRTGDVDLSDVRVITGGIAAHFRISLFSLLPLLILLVLILRKIPAVLAMLAAILSGLVLAIVVQGVSLKECFMAMYSGFQANTGDAFLDRLLSRGGLLSMSSTIILMVFSMMVAGCLQRTRIMETLMTKASVFVKGERRLVISSLIMEIILCMCTGDIYASMLITTTAMREHFHRFGLDNRILGRTLQDGTTIIITLIPWGTGGAYALATLGVPVSAFAPWYFIGYLTPLFSILLILTGIGVKRVAQPSNAKEDGV